MARTETLEFRPQFFRGFRGMAQQARDASKALSKLRVPLRKDLNEHARREASPKGGWKRRSNRAETRANKRRARVVRGRRRGASARRGARQAVSFIGGGKLLGQLPDTVVIRKSRNQLEARSPVPWSGVHNEGGTAGNNADIPARPFVFISPEILRRAQVVLADHLVEKWGRR